ncbi:MAG: Rsd/AlgQ family anti-sigma factor [Acidiferrobacteraceae bacterium]
MAPTTQESAGITSRRTQSRELADKLVAQRKEMLVVFWRLAGLEPFGPEPNNAAAQKDLQEFCQLLVDYIATGHFVLYERIVNGTERRKAVSDMAKELYPRISEATDAALEFNDKYDCGDHCEITDTLNDDLSRIGEELALRAELEDQLLTAMTGKATA